MAALRDKLDTKFLSWSGTPISQPCGREVGLVKLALEVGGAILGRGL